MYRFIYLALLGLTACSGMGQLKYASPQEAFEKGKYAYEKRRWLTAIDYFKGVFDFGRTNEYADDAQFYLGKSYLGNKEYLLAIAELARFSALYRSDPRSKEAEFDIVMAYYKQSPTYELDQTDTEKALVQMNSYLQRYPTDPSADRIREMANELKEKLAYKALYNAQNYEQRELYVAAVNSYQKILSDHPGTSYGDDALLGAVRSQNLYAAKSIPEKQKERFQEALRLYNRMIELFPNTDLKVKAEEQYSIADRALQALK